jgi:hypothetical protein
LLKESLTLGSAEDNVLLSQDGVIHFLDGAPHFIRVTDVHRGIELSYEPILNAAFKIHIGITRRGNRGPPNTQFLKSGRRFSGLVTFFDPFQ